MSKKCPDCNGKGWAWEPNKPPTSAITRNLLWKTKCQRCKGTGQVK